MGSEREPRPQRPTAAIVLSLLGGALSLLVSLVIIAFGAFLKSSSGLGFVVGVGAFGLLVSLGIIAGAVLLYLRPARHAHWGSVVITFSILSLFTSFGGLLVGMLLGLVGGGIGVAWKPSAVQTLDPSTGAVTIAQQGFAKACPGCGAQVAYETRYCPHCGHAF